MGKNSAAAAYADYVEEPLEQIRVESASQAIAKRHHEEFSVPLNSVAGELFDCVDPENNYNTLKLEMF